MVDLAQFETDRKLETEGVWKDFDDAQFLVARLNNPAFKRRFNQIQKQNRGRLSEEKKDDLAREAVAEHVLLDFKGVDEESEGKKRAMKNTLENRRKILAVDVFYDFVFEVASDYENYLKQAEDADVKN